VSSALIPHVIPLLLPVHANASTSFDCCHLVGSVKRNAVSWHWNVAFLEAEDTGDHQSLGPVLIIFSMAYVIYVTVILRLPPKFETSCV
jgi:hypothetical protein